MAKQDGGTLAFSLGGTVIACAREASLEDESVETDTTCAGDAVEDANHLRTRHTVEFRALIEVATPYVIPGFNTGSATLRTGETLAWAIKFESADTNGIVSCAGSRLARLRIEGSYDGVFQISGTLRAKGNAIVTDTTPN